MNFLKKLFSGRSTTLKDAYANGAIIIDVRTKKEYQEGHIKGSFNVPLHQLPKKIKSLKAKKRPIITCCRSGGRAQSALVLLQKEGITCYNGGGWTGLRKKLRSSN